MNGKAVKPIDFLELEGLAGEIKGKIDNLSKLPQAELFDALIAVFLLQSTLSGLTFKDALIAHRQA
jgi:hypothetical protein